MSFFSRYGKKLRGDVAFVAKRCIWVRGCVRSQPAPAKWPFCRRPRTCLLCGQTPRLPGGHAGSASIASAQNRRERPRYRGLALCPCGRESPVASSRYCRVPTAARHSFARVHRAGAGRQATARLWRHPGGHQRACRYEHGVRRWWRCCWGRQHAGGPEPPIANTPRRRRRSPSGLLPRDARPANAETEFWHEW